MNGDTCRTCRFWQVFPGNDMCGRCPVLGVIFWHKGKGESVLEMFVKEEEDGKTKLNAEVALTGMLYSTDPVTEAIAVRTVRDFGCVFHVAKDAE